MCRTRLQVQLRGVSLGVTRRAERGQVLWFASTSLSAKYGPCSAPMLHLTGLKLAPSFGICAQNTPNSPRTFFYHYITEAHHEHENRSAMTNKTQAIHPSHGPRRSWLALPAPLRAIFNSFPLATYDECSLPQRTPTQRLVNSLYIFSSPNDLSAIKLSPNPACLKWQAYLLVNRIPFRPVPSTNHASPSGALPFLIPSSKPTEPQPSPLASNKIQRWAADSFKVQDSQDVQLDPYFSLIDQDIRHGWLVNLYLNDHNFDQVAVPLYVNNASSNLFVRTTLAVQLKTAARTEILKSKPLVDEDDIYQAANRAFSALSTLLSQDSFFGASDAPGMLDLALFAYTYPLLRMASLDETSWPSWENHRLYDMLNDYQNLVDHSARLLSICAQGYD